MRDRQTVIHLIDDTTAGGVMRVLDHIKASPEMAELADHRFERVRRGKVAFRRYDGDVIVSHLAVSWRSLPALLAIRMANPGAKFVHVEHSYTGAFVRHNVPNIRRFHALLRLAFSRFDAVVAVSDAQGRWLRDEGLCPADKLFQIRSCVDLSPFLGLRPARRRPRVIGAIGRLDRQKGFDVLIQAFRAVSRHDVALHFYGVGDELETLRALAAGDPRIVFKGFVPDPVQAYEEVDLVVVPSRWEAYGLVAIEALCAGRGVLCADVDGLRDHREYGADYLDGPFVGAATRRLDAILGAEAGDDRLPGEEIAARADAAFHRDWGRLLHAL